MSRRNARFTIAAVLLVAFALALAVAACGDDGSTTTSTPSGSATPTAASPGASAGSVHSGAIVYSRLWPNEGIDVCLINTDGTGSKELTQGGEAKKVSEGATWSPDGTSITYHAGDTISSTPDVWVMNADGSKKRQLTHARLGGLWPAFSRDGMRIAYCSFFYPPDRFPPAHIYVMNADGSDSRQVTRGKGNDMLPTWAPDGRIFFLRKPWNVGWDGPDGDVWAVRPDGSGLVRVTKLGHVGGFGLSPDGRTLAIHDTEQRQIVTVPVDGSETPVTLVDTDFELDLVQPAWSPDGQALALAHSDLMTPASVYDAASLGLWVVNADGSGLTTVPNAEGVISIAWRPE